MSVAPIPQRRVDRLGTAASQSRPAPTKRELAGRRPEIVWSKRLLPVGALVLLGSIAMWPQISSMLGPRRITLRHGSISAEMQSGKLLNVRYHGIDSHDRPYTITAAEAVQVGPERFNLVEPKGDAVNESGAWTYVESRKGVYIQHAGLLDLSGDVLLYRDSGVTLTTQSVAMDLKAGAASSNEPTHAEGPFGTLDSQGFALVDKGGLIQFDGKSHLVLNGAHH